jgi:hypothetical protein
MQQAAEQGPTTAGHADPSDKHLLFLIEKKQKADPSLRSG